MATQQALDSLKILAGGRRQQPLGLEEYGFSGAVPTQGELESPFEQEQAARAFAADTRDRERTSDVQQLNNQMADYSRPDVTAVRQEEQNNALKKLLLPIQMRGQYDVEAAKQQAQAQAARDERLIGGRQGVAETNQAGAANRAADQHQIALQSQLNNLYKTRQKAAGGGLRGILGMGGPSEQDKIDTQIKSLEAQLNGGGTAAPGGSVSMIAPDGRTLSVPASDVARLESLGARRQ